MADIDIDLRDLAPTHVHYLRETLDGVDQIPAMIQDGFGGLMSSGVMPTAPAFSVFHDPEFSPEHFDYEIAYPVADDAALVTTPAGRQFRERVVPGGKAMVHTHHGSYDDIGQVYEAMGQWMGEQGLHPAGPPQEAYLTAPDDPEGPVTEVRWPVA